MGCLVPGCDEITAIDSKPQTAGADFIIYPNPVHDMATVEVQIPDALQIIAGKNLELQVIDMQGRKTDIPTNISLTNGGEIIRFQIQTSAFAQGNYMAVILYNNTILGSSQWVKM
ncbi:MAG: T9SS type A sorting domain-containing protein [Chitinophagales bacterium]